MISNKKPMGNKLGLKDSDIETIVEVLSRESKVDKAIVFGSRAKGNYKNGSDVDIALKGNELNFGVISKISYWLNEETHMPYKFDVLNYNTIKEPALTAHIDRVGIEFYSRWKKYQLEEIATVQTGPFGSQLHMSDYKLEGTPIITVEHLGDNRIIHENLPLVGDEDKNRLKKYLLKEGDIVFSRVGSVDRCAYVSVKEDDWMFSGRCLRVRTNEKVNPRFLSFYFHQENFKEHIRRIAVGATMPSINTSILSEVEIILPPLTEQKSIAETLSSLDDKIDLLHRQNKTLDELSKTLFRQFFIEEEEENWKEVELGEFISVKHGYAFKGNSISEESTKLILVTPGNFKIGGGFKFDKFKYYKNEDFPKEYIFQAGDLAVTMTDLSVDGDTLGYSALIPESFQDKVYLHNQRVGKVEFKKEIEKHFVYFLMRSREYQWYVMGGASGTAIRHTSPTSICSYSFKLPPKEKRLEFEKVAAELEIKIRKNQVQVENLTQLRDTLLPKLMSGEIRLN